MADKNKKLTTEALGKLSSSTASKSSTSTTMAKKKSSSTTGSVGNPKKTASVIYPNNR